MKSARPYAPNSPANVPLLIILFVPFAKIFALSVVKNSKEKGKEKGDIAFFLKTAHP
jgi:hypothetical protein